MTSITYDWRAKTRRQPDGTVEPIPDSMLSHRAALLAKHNLAPTIPVERPRGCTGCGRPKVVNWLGVRWYGQPWPLRWSWPSWSSLPVYTPAKGCGCVVKLKNVGTALGMVVNAVRWWWRS